MNIIRKIKINSLGMYEFNDSEKELLEFIKENMLNLKIIELKNYPDYIMYFNDKGENIFQQDLKTPWFYVRYNLIWKVFETKFNLNYKETSNLIKGIVEQAYKLQGVTPFFESKFYDKLVEQAYKLQGVTPSCFILDLNVE